MKFAKKLLIILGIAFLPMAMFAEGEDDEEVKEFKSNYKAELEKDYIKNLPWEMDFDKAKARAKKEKKVILTFITRSYAPCPPCVQVETGLLASKEFKAYVKDKIIYLSICTKIPERKYDYLYRKLNYNGFPVFTMLSEEGKVLAEPDIVAVNCNTDDLETAYKKAMKKAGIFDKESVKVKDELKKELAAVKKKAKEYDEQAQFDLEIYAIVQKMKKMDKAEKEAFDDYAKDFYNRYKDSKRTNLFHNNFRFYDLVIRHAIKSKDGETAKSALKELEKASEAVEKRLPRRATEYNRYMRKIKKAVRDLTMPEEVPEEKEQPK